MPKNKYRILSSNPDHVSELNKYGVCCCAECREKMRQDVRSIQFIETRKATPEDLARAAYYYPSSKKKGEE